MDGIVVDCDGGNWDVCPYFSTQGTIDAMDCVCFCDGTDECESTHPSVLQGARHDHRLHGVKSLHNLRIDGSVQMVLVQKLTAFAWNVYDGRQNIDVPSPIRIDLIVRLFSNGKRTVQSCLHRLYSTFSATCSSSPDS